MKVLLTITIFFFSLNIIACECALQNTIEKVENADFVAQISIKSVIRDSINNEYLNLDVELIKLFKGEFSNNLKILTNQSMCNINPPKNTEWIIFASNDKNGELSFGYCSGSIQIDRNMASDQYPRAETNHKKSIDRKLGLLKFLNNNNIIPENSDDLVTSMSKDCLNNLKGYYGEEGEFAIFEFTIKKDLSVSQIKQLKKFSNSELNSELLKCVNSMHINYRDEKDKLLRKTMKILPVFYYPSERGNESFLSTWDL
jgi:hypothetical protein